MNKTKSRIFVGFREDAEFFSYLSLYCLCKDKRKSQILRECTHQWCEDQSKITSKELLLEEALRIQQAKWQKTKTEAFGKGYSKEEINAAFILFLKESKVLLRNKISHFDLNYLIKNLKQ